MRIIDQTLMDELRNVARCELCRKPLRYQAEIHHAFTRGAGRLDIRINLIALGGPWDCLCHHLFHNGKIDRSEFLKVIGKREKVTPESIELAVFALRRADKNADSQKILDETLDYAT